METSRIAPRIAREDDYWVFALGGRPTNYFVTRIAKRAVFEWAYDFTVQVSNFLPLAPAGSTSPYPSGTQAPWVNDVIMTLTSISNVPNIFTLTSQNEMLQLFWGAAPSPLTLYKRQPVNQNAVSLDQNIFASVSYYDPGLIDGFASPFDRPAPETETWILGGIDANWALGNEGMIPIAPKINMFIVRSIVEPISDAETLKRIFSGSLPSKKISLGDPKSDLTSALNTSLYTDAKTVTRTQALSGGA